MKEILRTGTSDIASGMLRECADALTELWSMQSASGASSGMRLPVLADRFTGDPHALDWNRKQGRLFFYGIREIWSRRLDWTEKEVAEDGWDELYIGASTNQEEEEQADDIIKPPVWSGRQSLELRMVYRMAGVLDDDVSSQVLVWGRPFSESHGVALTLHQVEEWTCWPKQGNIYIVENPSVFSSLLDAACNYKDRKHANEEEKLLVCWSGQPSAAAVLLLDCLHNRMEAASRFFYSGDFDVNGLAIANFAANRYKERFQAWKMDGATYEQYVRPKKAFTDQERTKLKKAQYTWDSTLGYRMDDNGYKCFQESILPLLLREWIE